MQGEQIIIKVCGMRDGNNIREIEAAHPSMMGFICWKGSSRNVTVKPSYMPNCIRVGVFVNPSEDEILSAKEMLNLNYIQLHGNESSTLCKRIKETMNLKLIKAISVESKSDIQKSEP
ncbi:MAG: phosphoribosylanthranilate isomerase, partial [Paraprevotella sp.]|nr:phosphoribosylanthranilate isomerase [Paraprevotella sp.]